jgi:hypothetical protein
MQPSGVVYHVTSIPLCEYNITYVTPPPPKRRWACCCVALLFRSYASAYKAKRPG